VSITDRCNLSCVYCKPQARLQMLAHSEILRYEEILRLVSIAVALGIVHVRLTGGEPLIRRGVLDFIAELKKIKDIKDISLTTNGVLLDEMAAGLRDAGISRLNISLDSLDARKFFEITGSDCWGRVWRGINRAEEAGFSPLKINMVPVKGINDGEVADFARLTIERNIHVRFIEFMPIGANDRWHRESCVTADEIRAAIEREVGPLVPFTSQKSAGPSDNYQIAGARGVIGFISPISKHFCASCRRLRLTADGKIRPCLLSDTEIDVKSPLRAAATTGSLNGCSGSHSRSNPSGTSITEAGAGCSHRSMSKIGG
jgi:cyclic pyranopterin phosphate synthase